MKKVFFLVFVFIPSMVFARGHSQDMSLAKHADMVAQLRLGEPSQMNEALWLTIGMALMSLLVFISISTIKKYSGASKVALVLTLVVGVFCGYQAIAEGSKVDGIAIATLNTMVQTDSVDDSITIFAKHAHLKFSEKHMNGRAYAFVWPRDEDYKVAFLVLDRNIEKAPIPPNLQEKYLLKKARMLME